MRRPGRWLLTRGDQREPTELTVAGLADLVAASTGPCPFWGAPSSPGAIDWAPLTADQWIEPAAAFLAHACSGRLHVEGAEGRRLLLDDVDIALLDQVVELCTVADAARRTGIDIDTARTRLGQLRAVGRLRLSGPPTDEAPAPSPSVHHRTTPRDIARRVRDRVRPVVTETAPPVSADHRIPVYSVWQVEIGPNLALGMLLAHARHHRDGALESAFDLRRLEPPASFLADLEQRRGPAILLCSNYVWSLEHNLDLARRAKHLNPDLLIVHGGPSTPKYEGDAEAFVAANGDVVDVLVRGEGEVTMAEVLDRLAAAPPPWDLRVLDDVAGLSYVTPEGTVVRTAERERVADLDLLPSPYLTGEFDHIPTEAFVSALSIETNRGCPYGCTFCDWGSATLARIRKFDLERVKAELDWAGERGLVEWNVTDANFGIMSRDVTIAEHIAAVRRTHGVPDYFGFTVAKNTTKHLAKIVEILAKAGMSAQTSLSLQTRDEDTLDAVDRANINSDHYVRLAAEFRRRNIPLQGDLMLGLPGQTPESYRDDLQFMLDHEITARTWLTQLLPNSPMNEPGYRERFGIEVSPEGVVVATTSFDAADRHRMMRIRFAHTVFEHFGLLRHVLRHLQWEHGLEAMETAERVMDGAETAPDRYPLLNWVMRYFDLYTVPPLGWGSFYAEVRRFLADELGVGPTPALDTVLAVQQVLMPEVGREFPCSVSLAHDYLAYYRGATAELYRSGRATKPDRPLDTYPPATFEVHGDPAGLCNWRMRPFDDSRDETYVRPFWVSGLFELDSPLARNLPETRLSGSWQSIEARECELAELRLLEEETTSTPTPVRIGAA